MHVALLLIRSLLKSESPLSLSPVLLLKHSIYYWEVPLLLLEERSCWRPRNQKQVSISKLGRRVWDCKTQLWGGIYSLIPKLPPCIKWNYWMKKKQTDSFDNCMGLDAFFTLLSSHSLKSVSFPSSASASLHKTTVLEIIRALSHPGSPFYGTLGFLRFCSSVPKDLTFCSLLGRI